MPSSSLMAGGQDEDGKMYYRIAGNAAATRTRPGPGHRHGQGHISDGVQQQQQHIHSSSSFPPPTGVPVRASSSGTGVPPPPIGVRFDNGRQVVVVRNSDRRKSGSRQHNSNLQLLQTQLLPSAASSEHERKNGSMPLVSSPPKSSANPDTQGSVHELCKGVGSGNEDHRLSRVSGAGRPMSMYPVHSRRTDGRVSALASAVTPLQSPSPKEAHDQDERKFDSMRIGSSSTMLLPDGWSCPPNNPAGVVLDDENPLCLRSPPSRGRQAHVGGGVPVAMQSHVAMNDSMGSLQSATLPTSLLRNYSAPMGMIGSPPPVHGAAMTMSATANPNVILRQNSARSASRNKVGAEAGTVLVVSNRPIPMGFCSHVSGVRAGFAPMDMSLRNYPPPPVRTDLTRSRTDSHRPLITQTHHPSSCDDSNIYPGVLERSCSDGRIAPMNGAASSLYPGEEEFDLWHSDSLESCPGYYFEIKLVSGKAWVGFVGADVVSDETPLLCSSSSSSPYYFAEDGNDTFKAVADEGRRADVLSAKSMRCGRHPFQVLMGLFPGKCPRSIGLETGGHLYRDGARIGRSGNSLYGCSEDNMRGQEWGSNIGVGDSIGCGWECVHNEDSQVTTASGSVVVGGGSSVGNSVLCDTDPDTRGAPLGVVRVYFTLNGEVLYPENKISFFVGKVNGMTAASATPMSSPAYFFPAVGLMSSDCVIVGNFGQDKDRPLERLVVGSGAVPTENKISPFLAIRENGNNPYHAERPLDSIESTPADDQVSRDKSWIRPPPDHLQEQGKKVENEVEPKKEKEGHAAGNDYVVGHRDLSSCEHANDSSVDPGILAAIHEAIKDTSTPAKSVESSTSKEDEDVLAAINASLETKKQEDKRCSGHSFSTPGREKVEPITIENMEEFRSNARELRGVVRERNVLSDVVKAICNECEENQIWIKEVLERGEDVELLEELLDINDIISAAIEEAKDFLSKCQESYSVVLDNVPDHVQHSPPELKAQKPPAQQSSMPNVDALAKKKDVFNLICMLRSEARLEAANALMSLAKREGVMAADGVTKLRDEIISSGGMHSLLNLFICCERDKIRLKRVTALGVAYLVPSCSDPSHCKTSFELKLMECIRFLVNSSEGEDRKAAGVALTHRWINCLQPMFTSGSEFALYNETQRLTASKGIRTPTLAGEKQMLLRGRGRRLEQRQETIEMQELLEKSVALVVKIADDERNLRTVGMCSNLRQNLTLAVESMCAEDPVRPLVVRDGLIKVLVRWLSSGDVELEKSASNSLRELTSPHDEYMAGWIHSQIVEEGAIPAIVKLAVSNEINVRRAIAQILSSLSVAPHIRSAIFEANGVSYLVQLLNDAVRVHDNANQGWDENLALAAGSALLRLAAGAMRHASAWVGHGMDIQGSLSSSLEEKDGNVINEIVEKCALAPLVILASAEERVDVRLVAVELLRIVSDDVRPDRWTRQKLCEAGAAKAFGNVLRQDSSSSLLQCLIRPDKGIWKEDISSSAETKSAIQEIYHALHGLANMLEPCSDDEEEVIDLQLKFGTLEGSTTQATRASLEMICQETAESGGVDSLLSIASLPFSGSRLLASGTCSALELNDLLLECYRCLASLCPLLISPAAETKFLTPLAEKIMLTMNSVLKQNLQNDSGEDVVMELQFDALRGLCSLAAYEPLKAMIINDNDSLTQLLQFKNARKDVNGLAQAANQVLLTLQFTPQHMELAGNDPKLLGDWFLLERSLLVQAMARAEIRNALYHTWKRALEASEVCAPAHSRFTCSDSIPEAESIENNDDDGVRSRSDNITNLYDAQSKRNEMLRTLFCKLSPDIHCARERSKIIQQYEHIYGNHNKDVNPDIDVASSITRRTQVRRESCPIYTTCRQKDWILAHRRALLLYDDDNAERTGSLMEATSKSCVSLPIRVQELLDFFYPSTLLQSDVVPLMDFRPESTFDFRALAMPERRYFSFRREGQVLSRICDKCDSSVAECEGVQWSLNFTNSSFAGEFSETLVQTLYRCPSIQAIAFSRTVGEDADVTKQLDSDEEGCGSLLANLAGSLPPWITWWTFDNVLEKGSVQHLIHTLEKMGQRSAGSGKQRSKANIQREGSDGSLLVPQSGRTPAKGLEALAIRNCKPIRRINLGPFFDLLEIGGFLCLRLLDLSGNKLGDETCSVLLKTIYQENSRCVLEHLDLSGNSIGKGDNVIKVLRSYADKQGSRQARERGGSSLLKTLNLGSNSLQLGNAVEEVASMLQNNALNLTSLCLADNSITGEEGSLDEVLPRALARNTSVTHLNLSGNRLQRDFLDNLLQRIRAAGSKSNIAFLRIDDNDPTLSDNQIYELNQVMARARRERVEQYFQGQQENSDFDSMQGPGYEDMTQKIAVVEGKSTTETENKLAKKKDDFERPTRPPLRRFKSDSVAVGPIPAPKANRRVSLGGNKVTVLFSSPLVFRDRDDTYKPIDMLDIELERELLWKCFKEASMDIDLAFDTATTDRLQAAVTKCCGCLHYSGHGHPNYLTFEDGKGGLHWLSVDQLKDLIVKGKKEGGAPFNFVFVSACHSLLAGETFINAGVPHVVCCQQESQIMDSAALAFTRAFYLALAYGRTVKDAFEIGRQAVAVAPTVPNSLQEMRKFVLLPDDGNHDVPIFNADAVPEWPKSAVTNANALFVGRANGYPEQPLPSSPQGFIGRETEMYLVLNAVLARRFVSVIGVPGIGRSSLASSICHYINDRKSTMIAVDIIFYVHPQQARGMDQIGSFITPLYKQLSAAGLVDPLQKSASFDIVCQNIFSALGKTKALIVFDGVEVLEGSDEAKELPLFLSSLFRETKQVKVLMTARKELGLNPGGVGEYVFHLGPLNFKNTVRLFGILCPHVHTGQERSRLVNRLVPMEEENCLIDDEELTEESKKILSRLGGGIPAKTFDFAFKFSRNEYEALIKLGKAHSNNSPPR